MFFLNTKVITNEMVKDYLKSFASLRWPSQNKLATHLPSSTINEMQKYFRDKQVPVSAFDIYDDEDFNSPNTMREIHPLLIFDYLEQ